MARDQVHKMLVTGQEDLAWFESNRNILTSKYNNQFIAFHGKQVLASGRSVESVMGKLKALSVDTSNVLIEFVSKVKAIL